MAISTFAGFETLHRDTILHSGKIGLIFNVNFTHWISVAIDFTCGSILYGDSLGYKPDEDVLETLEWWLSQHTEMHFKLETLTSTRQRDIISCGLLAYNAIGHHFLPDSIPLV